MNFDFKYKVSGLLRRLALAMTLAAGAGFASANTIHVSIDTSSFGVATGFLDMQLSASGGVPLATALVNNMVGFDSSAFIDSWGVTSVPGGYEFRNDTSNDLFHAVNFGGLLSFDLTFAGDVDPLTSYISHFVVSAFDDNIAPLGNFDPVTGAIADFAWTPALTAGVDGSIGVTVSDARVSVVPEPADLLLIALGVAAMVLVMRRRAGQDSGSFMPLAA
jgi:hypothetical protein